MFSWFKNYFYPHEGNDHHPHLLRTEISAFILSLVLFGEVVFLFSIFVILPNTHFLADILPNVLVDSTNIERQKTNENQLTMSPLLHKAAQAKANDMATRGYFAHTSPDGVTPWYWIQQAGYSYTSAGENLAINFVDSQDVIIAWMNSPGHRANILNQSYTEIGVATARGMYQGQEATFVVQFLGRPDIQLAVTAPIVLVNQPPSPVLTLTPKPTTQPSASPVLVKNSQVKSETTTTQTIPPVTTQSSLKDRLLSNPKNMIINIFLIIALGFMLATIITFFVRKGALRTRAIINGVICMLIIIAIVYFDQYIGTLNAGIF